MSVWTQLIGFISGLVVCLSALPRIIALVRDPAERLHEGPLRNLALAAGNAGWVSFSALTHATPLLVTASVACTLNAIVLGLCLHARYTVRVQARRAFAGLGTRAEAARAARGGSAHLCRVSRERKPRRCRGTSSRRQFGAGPTRRKGR